MDDYSSIARNAETTDDALVALYQSGATAIDAIKALHYGRNISAEEAKSALRESATWSDELQAAEYQLDDILRELDDG